VRLRTNKTKAACRAQLRSSVFSWPSQPSVAGAERIGSERLAEIVRSIRFRDGEAVIVAEDQAAD